METIRARVSSELKEKFDKLEVELKKDSQRGSEVTTSSILRGAIENFIDEHKENTVTLKIDTNYLNENEIFLIEECLTLLEKSIKDKIKTQILLESNEDDSVSFDSDGNVYIDSSKKSSCQKLSDDDFKALSNFYLHISNSKNKLLLKKLTIAGE